MGRWYSWCYLGGWLTMLGYVVAVMVVQR